MRSHLAFVTSRQDAFLLPDLLSDSLCPPCFSGYLLDVILDPDCSILPSSKWLLVFLSTVTQKFSFKTLYFLLLSHSSSLEGTPKTDISFTLKCKSLRRGSTKPGGTARIYTQPGQELPWAAHKRVTMHTKITSVLAHEEQRSVHSHTVLHQGDMCWVERNGRKQEILDFWCGFGNPLLTKDCLNTSENRSLIHNTEARRKLYASDSKLTSHPRGCWHYTHDQGSDII